MNAVYIYVLFRPEHIEETAVAAAQVCRRVVCSVRNLIGLN